VFEGWRTIAEVNAEGKVIGRHELELPEQAAVALARTWAAKDGRRWFAISAPLAPQAFVFDEHWKRVLSYPPPGEPPLAVLDLALADLGEADGTPELLVASAAEQGLVALSLSGEVVWRNRTYPNVVSAAVAPDDLGSFAILLTGESGSILRVNRFGHEELPVPVANRSIMGLAAARFSGATQAALLGLSSDERGQRLAVGLTAQLKEAWNYPLPAGVHARPIEPITSSHVLPGEQGEWWLAGPDGSIHLIAEDGDPFDSFHYGAALTGLAATKLGEQPVLLVATDAGLSAMTIGLPLPKSATGSKLEETPKRARER
jgi:hypothetical protein